MRPTYCLFVLFIIFLKAGAQKIPDSLKGKSLDYLFDKIYETQDLKVKSIYADVIIKKGKIRKNITTITAGYSLKSEIFLDDRLLLYSDSIIELTKNNSNKYQPSTAFITKGTYYYKKRAFKKALESILRAKEFSKKNNSPSLIFSCNHYIGILKSRINLNEEAIEILKSNYNYIKTTPKEIDKHDYLSTVFALANSFNENKQYDSAYYYNKLGIKNSTEEDFYNFYNHFRLNQGVVHYNKQQYNPALDSIKKAISFLKISDDKSSLAVGYFYLAKIHEIRGEYDKMLTNLMKMDTIFLKNKDVLPKLKEGYKILLNHYKKNNDNINQLVYINRLITLDSILHENEIYLNKNIIKEYDIPRLISQKESIINDINIKNSRKRTYIVSLIILLILFGIGFYYQFKKRQLFEKRFLKIINTKKDSLEKTKVKLNEIGANSPINISEETINEILNNLESFEKNNTYLNGDLTLSSLAKKMNTNSRYLSKIINLYKQQSFTNYVNLLRVDYAINQLQNNPNYRKYTLLAIANEVGFKKTETFSKAFYKFKGIKPVYFIKQLNTSIKKHPNS